MAEHLDDLFGLLSSPRYTRSKRPQPFAAFKESGAASPDKLNKEQHNDQHCHDQQGQNGA